MIVISIVLSASLAVAVLILGEIEFSILSRESQRAFFAADAGAECALYWDIKKYSFATDSPAANPALNCADVIASSTPRIIPPSPPDTYYWSFTLRFANNTKANVTITKTGYPAFTVVRSYGYNSQNANEKNFVQRAIEVSY